MYKGQITSSVDYKSGNIPFSTVLNTNNNTSYDSIDNAVNIKAPGYYDVTAQIVVTGVAEGNISASLMADGNPLTTSSSTETIATASTEYATLTIHDVIKVDRATSMSFAQIGVQLSESATISNAVLIIERRK